MLGRIYRLLEQHKVLNAYQICRLLNGYGKDEYEHCYFSFKNKPLGSSAPHKRACKNIVGCKPKVTQVDSVLRRAKAPFQSQRMIFYDKGGIGRDLFRFWFIKKNDFQERILRQTLVPYIQGGNQRG